MPYVIGRDEPVDTAIRRLMDEQIVRAGAALKDEASPFEERIHDARKRFKETRAVIRLVREPLGLRYGEENGWYRDAGRELAGARDAAAVIEALEKLRKHARLPRSALRRLRAILIERHDRIAAQDSDELARHVADALAVARDRIALWPPLPDSFDAIGSGLLRVHRAGRRAMREALAAGGMPHHFHEWRKSVKVQWYHALLLRNVWPEMMKPWAAVLEQLSRTLGDHHDLVLMRQIVATHHDHLGRRSGTVAMLDVIDTRQRELEAEALRSGGLIHSERPRAWLARIRSAWEAWRG